MKVIRFMNETELQMYLSGAKIINFSKHENHLSTSFGSCFAELTPERDANKWLRKLFLIRPCEFCVEFDTDEFTTPLRESKATYSADDEKAIERGETIEVREWSTTAYSIYSHPYKRIGRCPDLWEIAISKKIEWCEPKDI